MRIEFTIPYFVEPKQGDRVQVVQRGSRVWAHHHPKKKVAKNAKALALFCARHRPEEPMAGPIRLTLVFLYPWRASEPLKNRHGEKLKDTKPDLDNLEKQITDVLERSGFFSDDAKIACKASRKAWTDQGSTFVRIEQMCTHERKAD